MAKTSRTFRIFVSSTFSDLKAERNALQALVFPRLRQLCEEHGAHFQPIDLRWGVSNEASLDQQAMNICLDEVARCQETSPRPNFVVLLGDRYGWMPPPAQIPEEEYQQILAGMQGDDKALLESWYTLDENALSPDRRLNPREKGKYDQYEDWQPIESRLQRILSDAVEELDISEERKQVYQASATHQEIIAGALKQANAPEHVFCFFRHIQNLPDAFNMCEFQKMVTVRVENEYPKGLSKTVENLVKEVLALSQETTAKDVSNHIKDTLEKTPKATDEQAALQFMERVLVDFIGKDFINHDEETWVVNQDAYDRLEQLKTHLKTEFKQNVFTNDDVHWTGDRQPSPTEEYSCITNEHIGSLPAQLEDCKPILVEGYKPQNLCEAMFRSLANVILGEIDDPHSAAEDEEKEIRIKPQKALKAEGLAHHKFAEERLEFFVGREGILKDIGVYMQGSERRILAIAAEGGAGKSALIAKAVEQTQGAYPNAQIIYRFIGATPASSDGRGLLASLCREISRHYGADESDIPIDYRDLVAELDKRMKLASEEKPLMLFLDSLDQLSASQGARGLSWLPNELPEHTRLVVSTRDNEETFDNLKPKNTILLTLTGLLPKDGEILLEQWLGSVGRKLQPLQREEVLKKFEQVKGNPLYLKLAFEEARLWRSYQELEELTVGLEGIIRTNMFERLKHEGNHGEMLVSRALGYLAASRYGLAEDELVDLLSRDLQVYEWFFRQTYHLPADLVELTAAHLKEHLELLQDVRGNIPKDEERAALAWLKQDRNPPEQVMGFLKEVLASADGPRLPIVLWSRLSFDLAPYLSERLVDGSSLLNFYHRELGDVSKAAFLGENQAKAFHEKLAEYFRIKADPVGDQSWTGGNIHGLSELPYHLTAAGKRDEVFHTLTDLKFLEHKAEEVGITRFEDEFGREQVTSDGVQQIQQDMEEALEAFYGGSSQRSNGDRAPLIRTAEERGRKLQVYCPVCDIRSTIDREMLGTVITCPQEDCSTKLKLNTFTIQPV